MGQRISAGPSSNPASITYAYTRSGRLASFATSGGVCATYTHDASGQRTSSRISSGGVTTDVSWITDGNSVLALTATSSAGATWALTYLRDAADTPYGGVYESASTSAPVLFATVTTERGDVVGLVDSAGVAFAAYRYDAFGVPLSVTSTATARVPASLAQEITARQVLRYAGYVWDAESGLYALGARSYDPYTAQFTSRDPMRADGEESPYQYCGGDPVGAVDPSGMIADWSGEGRATVLNAVVHTYYNTRSKHRRAHLRKRMLAEERRERRARAALERARWQRRRAEHLRLAAEARADAQAATEEAMLAESVQTTIRGVGMGLAVIGIAAVVATTAAATGGAAVPVWVGVFGSVGGAMATWGGIGLSVSGVAVAVARHRVDRRYSAEACRRDIAWNAVGAATAGGGFALGRAAGALAGASAAAGQAGRVGASAATQADSVALAIRWHNTIAYTGPRLVYPVHKSSPLAVE